MKTRNANNLDAAQARAALEALFGGPAPSSEPAAEQVLEGHALIARKAANANALSSKVDLLRRKREAMTAVQQAAASLGFSIEELRQAVAEPASANTSSY
ncbi:hypothetical protein FNU76_20085 [Chitinimonas arctica]|uniref:Uncharacterized protein n=1 Tax=Chitinimonas arctica TaxID=2594795 RepID=A0A516SJZ0_9NEIS|nr:hypothetical protein [Chitinimonas arctica]QDQ28472.1 hypothetical protein FNU76_20085 [Chitinimonas arctica]